MNRIAKLGAFIGVAGLLLAGCGQVADPPVSTDAGTPAVSADSGELASTDAGILRIGIRYNVPGVGYIVGDGEPTGFDVDVAAYVAWKLGYSPKQIQWVPMCPHERIPALLEDRVDLVFASMAITDERREEVDFAGPYLASGHDLLVRADELGITGPDSVAGRTVCLIEDTIGVQKLRSVTDAEFDVIERPTYADCLDTLVSGEADAISSDAFVLAGYAASEDYFGSVRLLGAPFSDDTFYGVGMPKGSTLACTEIDEALTEMFDDGSWSRFIERHTGGIGFDPNDYQNPPTIDSCR